MQAALFTLIPWAALLIGAVATVFLQPGPQVRSGVQHFAAGVVFAAAATEILPDVKHAGSLAAVMVGAVIGVAAMLALKSYGRRAQGAVGLAAATGIDILIDGLVLGISFAAGARQGVLLTLALTVEVLFLGLTLAGQFAATASARWKAVALTGAIGLGLPLGALCGSLAAGLPPTIVTGFYAFSLIALLYLVTEELLVEAHETADTPAITAMFFAGFLVVLLIEDLMRA